MIDIVNGIVIGEISAKYILLYEDREQFSWTDISLSNFEAKEKANKWIQDKKEELGKMLFNRLYPDNKWELRIYD